MALALFRIAFGNYNLARKNIFFALDFWHNPYLQIADYGVSTPFNVVLFKNFNKSPLQNKNPEFSTLEKFGIIYKTISVWVLG